MTPGLCPSCMGPVEHTRIGQQRGHNAHPGVEIAYCPACNLAIPQDRARTVPDLPERRDLA